MISLNLNSFEPNSFECACQAGNLLYLNARLIKEIMNEGNSGPEFLKARFPGLASSPEVKQAARRIKHREGIEFSSPEERIQNYLDRFKELLNRNEPSDKVRGIKALKKVLVGRYAVRVEDIPDNYWQSQMRLVRNRGQLGDWQDLSQEEVLKIKQEHLAQTKEDQKGSLEEWVDYLVSDKSSYLPDYLKYWAFAGMLKLERYEKGEKDDKENIIKPGRFPERPTGRQRSAKMFPEVNERALRFIAESYSAKSNNQAIHFRYDIPQKAREVFLKDLEKKDFRLLYGFGQEYIPPISGEEMQTTVGQWVTYPRENNGSQAKILSRTLQGKGSGWCIAGENVAQSYLKNGDLSVYYTKDKEGNFTIPRVVIVTSGDRVSEVRGIEWEENVDKYIKETNIIGDKLKELPGGESFFETDRDTKQLTLIDKKITAETGLNKSELAFLYEVDRPIKYFGYKKDPRIEEIISKRNLDEDMLIILNCSKDQIASRISEIRQDTKAYIGPLEKGIFDILSKYNIEHIYTSFPEGKIKIETLGIGGRDKKQLKRKLKQESINITAYTEDLINSPDFTTLKTPQEINTVKLKVQDLGLEGLPTTDEIYKRAKELGLDLCSPEVGVYQRLKDTGQPLGDWYYIAMKQIADRDGYPGVFLLVRHGDGLWLNDAWASPGRRWDPGDGFVFGFRKKTQI